MTEGKGKSKTEKRKKTTGIHSEKGRRRGKPSSMMPAAGTDQDKKRQTLQNTDKAPKHVTQWPNIMMGIWKTVPYFTAADDAMEPFIELATSQQQSSLKLFHSCVDFQLKLNESGHTGDVRKVNEICLALSGEFFKAWQASIKEQTLAFYKFWRKYIPILPGSLENMS